MMRDSSVYDGRCSRDQLKQSQRQINMVTAQARITLKQACKVMWMPLRTAALRAAFATLDSIILPDLLKKRPSVKRSVPHFLKGPFRNALRLALEEAVSEEVIRQERCWKLLLLLPRMLLHRYTTGRFDC